MAILTELPFSAASALVEQYGLSLRELRPLAAGSVNSNFFLDVRDGDGRERSLFARIYEEQGPTGAEFELRLNQVLGRNGIPVAHPLPLKNGRLSTTFSGKPFALYERLQGEVSCQAQVTATRCFSVGRALASVHVADLGSLQPEPSRFGFQQIRERLLRVEAAGRRSLAPAVQSLRIECDRLERARSEELPKGLIHGDLFRDNVLLSGDEVSGLLDFESASLGTFAYDLMVTILAWCFADRLDESLVQAMLEGYLSVRSLSPREQEALPLEGAVACLRFATTRLTDFSLRVPEGQPPGRDYQRFFERNEALKSGMLARVLSKIG